MDLEENIFLLAGPVKMHRRVLNAMAHPAIAHRDVEFSEKIGELRELLKYLFQTKNDVALFSGSGTVGMDAVIANVLKKNDKILTVSNGKFGERFYEIGSIYGQATALNFDWGSPINLEQVEKKLEDENYKKT